ncbi:YozD family protein [Bacillus salacetis]|uniref:YozD family protein n=1 Tax=Bacillus salacetis TaxID=2315464 RepID=A0A3A1QTW0_9BACI|nr:YozD family protein [Bacillus salacetis]RIW28513.1 YozD family protein [Bacillus salacetis]
MREIEVFIDTEEIAEFFFQELVRRGYVPSEEELEEIADITFEYLIEKCIIDEEPNDDDY